MVLKYGLFSMGFIIALLQFCEVFLCYLYFFNIYIFSFLFFFLYNVVTEMKTENRKNVSGSVSYKKFPR